MLSPRVRSVVTGLMLVLALMVALPGSTEAAGLRSSGQEWGVWSLVVSWFSDLWTGAFQDGGTATLSSASSATTDPGTGGPTTSGAICGGDQGMCIDPNG